jgi:predicted secreted protein
MSGTVGYAGREGALQISTNGGSTYVTLPGVRATNTQFNSGAVDISNASSADGWQEMLAGGAIRTMQVSVDGIVSTGAAFVAFFAHVQNGTIGRFRVEFGNGGQIDFQASVNDYQIGAPYNDAQTFSATLSSHRAPVFTAPT